MRPAAPAAAAPARAAEQHAADGPSNLPGIDTRAGLARMMGKTAFYQKQLLKFLASQSGFADDFRRASAGADPAARKRLAHTLKGLAGNIGATKLQAAAAKLQAACDDPREDMAVDRALAATLAELDIVLGGLAALHDDKAAAHAGDMAVDRTKASELLDNLLEMLAASDARSEEIAGELAALLVGSSFENDIAGISSAVANYDFDIAIKLVRPLREKLAGAGTV